MALQELKPMHKSRANCIPCIYFFVTDINLKENPLSDKRLFKLVEQCRTKQIQDYVKNHGYASKSDSQTVTGNKNQANKSNKTDSIEKDGNVKAHKIKVIRALEDGFKVQYLPEVENSIRFF